MTTHSHTWIRKRIGGIEFTRRRFALIWSMYVQRPRLRSNFQCVSSSISVKRFHELSYQSKASALLKSEDHQEVHGFQTKRCRHTLNFTRSESDYLRRLFTLHSDRKRWVLENALNYCPVSCDVHLTSGTLISSLRLLYDRLIVFFDRPVFRDVGFLIFQVRQINSEICWPRQERLLRDFLDKKSET